MLEKQFVPTTTTKTDENELDGVVFLGEDEAPPAPPPVPEGKLSCKLCNQPPKAPFKARCAHVCCHECWIMWLGNRPMCPVCKVPTTLRQLTKVFFQ